MNKNRLTVLISSYGNRLIQFLEKFPEQNEKTIYLIAHQNYQITNIDIINNLIKDRTDITYYPIDSIGVTKSRNYLLEKCSDGVIWFCDDDIIFNDNFQNTILDAHENDSSSIITFIVNDEFGNPRKTPLSDKIITRTKLSILSVGTIEITMKRSHLNSIRFSEDMGAGSSIPIGDEAVFLSNCIEKKHKISFHPEVICSHPIESSGNINSQLSNYSRGITIRRVYKLTFPIVSILFMLRRAKLLKLNNSYMKGFYFFLKGIVKNK